MAPESPLAVNRAPLEAVFADDPYLARLGAELVEWDGGWAVFRLPAGAEHTNFLGTVHGGALFSLADAALSVASNSWGRVCVALAVEIKFLSAPAPGEALLATATERSRTHRTASYAVDVTSETGGDLRASFSAMAYRTSRWHLGEEAWPADWRTEH